MATQRAGCQSSEWCPCYGQLVSVPRRSFGVVRARRFELVDAKERPWATLGFNDTGEAQLQLLNRSGSGEILLLFYEENPELYLIHEGNTRAIVRTHGAEVELELSDDNGSRKLEVKVEGKGEPHIWVCKEQGEFTDVLAERGA